MLYVIQNTRQRLCVKQLRMRLFLGRLKSEIVPTTKIHLKAPSESITDCEGTVEAIVSVRTLGNVDLLSSAELMWVRECACAETNW